LNEDEYSQGPRGHYDLELQLQQTLELAQDVNLYFAEDRNQW
jgi:hypothetical protein